VVVCLICILFCIRCGFRYMQSTTVDSWSSTLRVEGRTSSIWGRAATLSRTSFPNNTNLVTPLIPQTGSLTVGEDPHPRAHPSQPREDLLLEGVGVADIVPTVHSQGQSAELVCLTRRVLTEPTAPTPEALERFNNPRLQCMRELSSIRIRERGDIDFEEWLVKFPEHQRRLFAKAYEANKGQPPTKPENFKIFTKGEKDKEATRDGSADLKPRGISSPRDAVKVMTGPAIAKIYRKVRQIWNGINSRVCYASGYTPDELGRITQSFIDKCGGEENVIGLSNDCAVYDSTLENELLETRRIYRNMGMTELTYAWLTETSNRGSTAHGIRYNLGVKMVDGKSVPIRRLRSGEMDTNLIGSIINAKAHESGLPSDMDYLMLVCGDDNLLLARKVVMTPLVISNLQTHLEHLGLRPTPIVSEHRYDWEFCSRLPWYALDPTTGAQRTVWGPKPGRLLTRIGWTLKNPRDLNFKATLLSIKDDVAHIPMLAEYVAHMLPLTRGMEARGREHSELKHVSRPYMPSPLNMRILEQRYQLSEAHCLEFIDALRAVTSLGSVISFPWMEGMFKRDK